MSFGAVQSEDAKHPESRPFGCDPNNEEPVLWSLNSPAISVPPTEPSNPLRQMRYAARWRELRSNTERESPETAFVGEFQDFSSAVQHPVTK